MRPSAGIINPGVTLNISVHIQAGYSASQLVRDKFLVMACTVEGDSATNVQVAEIWKVILLSVFWCGSLSSIHCHGIIESKREQRAAASSEVLCSG